MSGLSLEQLRKKYRAMLRQRTLAEAKIEGHHDATRNILLSLDAVSVSLALSPLIKKTQKKEEK